MITSLTCFCGVGTVQKNSTFIPSLIAFKKTQRSPLFTRISNEINGVVFELFAHLLGRFLLPLGSLRIPCLFVVTPSNLHVHSALLRISLSPTHRSHGHLKELGVRYSKSYIDLNTFTHQRFKMKMWVWFCLDHEAHQVTVIPSIHTYTVEILYNIVD